MKITSFGPNVNGSKLILELEDAELADILYLWDSKTYKDYSKLIDLSDKLDQTNAQTISIDVNDVQTNVLSGLFIVQIEGSDPNEPSEDANIVSAITGVYTAYEECILDRLSSLKLCDDCLENISIPLLNSQALLEGLKFSVEQGFIEEAKQIQKALEKFCSNDCKTCGKYPNILDDEYYGYNAE